MTKSEAEAIVREYKKVRFSCCVNSVFFCCCFLGWFALWILWPILVLNAAPNDQVLGKCFIKEYAKVDSCKKRPYGQIYTDDYYQAIPPPPFFNRTEGWDQRWFKEQNKKFKFHRYDPMAYDYFGTDQRPEEKKCYYKADHAAGGVHTHRDEQEEYRHTVRCPQKNWTEIRREKDYNHEFEPFFKAWGAGGDDSLRYGTPAFPIIDSVEFKPDSADAPACGCAALQTYPVFGVYNGLMRRFPNYSSWFTSTEAIVENRKEQKLMANAGIRYKNSLGEYTTTEAYWDGMQFHPPMDDYQNDCESVKKYLVRKKEVPCFCYPTVMDATTGSPSDTCTTTDIGYGGDENGRCNKDGSFRWTTQSNTPGKGKINGGGKEHLWGCDFVCCYCWFVCFIFFDTSSSSSSLSPIIFSLFPGRDTENGPGLTKENLWNGRSSDFSNQLYTHQHSMTWKEKGTNPGMNGIRHAISSVGSPCSADVRLGWYNYRRLDGEKEKKIGISTEIKTEKMKKETTPFESHGGKARDLDHDEDFDYSNMRWRQSYLDRQPVEDVLANDCKKRKMATDANTPDCPIPHEGDTSVKATCSDEDGSCFDGDDMWNCAGIFYCSNDGAEYAKKLGGILCPNQNRRRATQHIPVIKKDDLHAHTANNVGTASRGATPVAHGPILNAGTRFYNCMSGLGNMYYDQAFIGWGPVSQANRFYHGREQLIVGIIFFVLICFCCLYPCFYFSLPEFFERKRERAQEASKVLKSKDFAPSLAEEQRLKDQAAEEQRLKDQADVDLDHANSEFVAVEMVDFTDSHSTSVQEVE